MALEQMARTYSINSRACTSCSVWSNSVLLYEALREFSQGSISDPRDELLVHATRAKDAGAAPSLTLSHFFNFGNQGTEPVGRRRNLGMYFSMK
jgi:hypothetical protein